MNNYKSIIFLISAILISLSGYGQKWKSDPSYSVHNYKHPNKAAIAKKADTARLQNITYMEALVPVSRNYKAQNVGVARKPQTVQVMSLPSKNTLINGNYKQQFAPSARKKN
jgi:hypothetical protein